MATVSKDIRPAESIDEEQGSVKSLEQRYISLLEDKIKRLEAERGKSTEDEIRYTKVKEEEEEETPKLMLRCILSNDDATKIFHDEDKLHSSETPKVKESKRVRYIYRDQNSFGEPEDTVVKKWETTGSNLEETWDRGGDATVISWRRHRSQSGYVRQELLIESKALRDALKNILDVNLEGLSFDTDEVAIEAPYAVLYHSQEEIKQYADQEANEATRADIMTLLAELEKEQRTSRRDAEMYKNNGLITYDILWTLFYVGCPVLQEIMGELQMYIVNEIAEDRSEDGYGMWIWGIEWDGTEWRIIERWLSIKKFSGTKAITELEVYPFEMWKDEKENGKSLEEMENFLEERGRRFEKLCYDKLENRHRAYTGVAIPAGSVEMAVEDGSDQTSVVPGNDSVQKADDSTKLERNSFVMIDHYAYLNLFKIGPTPLKFGKEDAEWLTCTCKKCVAGRLSLIGDLPTIVDGKIRGKLTPEQLRLCPPRILGFAVAQKKFVQLLLKNIQDKISKADKEKAFSDLELPKTTKQTLKKLICEHTKGDFIEDLIPDKGKGLVVLLHGPPGVGKTLTAESLAILTGKPLYSVSMSDVGSSPTTVEFNLRRIFQLATHWKALLLFDEADVFLEARSLQDVRRNSLVSVLLRILEYFQGILFLTSNRVKTFDEAFQSRIHFAIQYFVLSEKQRKSIWQMWFRKAEGEIDEGFEWEEYLDEEGRIIKHKLNGRQIRNVFRSAMTLAKAEGNGKLKWGHVEEILTRTMEFQTYMVQGEELAKRENLR